MIFLEGRLRLLLRANLICLLVCYWRDCLREARCCPGVKTVLFVAAEGIVCVAEGSYYCENNCCESGHVDIEQKSSVRLNVTQLLVRIITHVFVSLKC